MDYIYIDESGELSKQSKYFVIAAIKVNNPKIAKRLIKNIRNKYKKKLGNIPEIKGYTVDNEIVKKILMNINDEDFQISAVFLDKKNLYKIPNNFNYNQSYDYIASKLAKFIYINNPTSIFIDKSKNKQKEIEDFNKKFLLNLNNFKGYPITIRHVNSKNYEGLQVADIISWSIFQSLENKNSEFIDLIENINIEEL